MNKNNKNDASEYLSALPCGLIDFHSHILPGMDDGSKSVEESLGMLEILTRAGVDTVIATPHFYARSENPQSFFARRKTALDTLNAALPAGAPRILAGAEVYYFDGLVAIDELREFRIGGTELILIEMPFRKWSERVVQDVISIHSKRGFRVILAHAERYYSFGNVEAIRELSSNGVIIQANASWFNAGFFTRRAAMRALNEGLVDLIGSDCHNLTDRAPDLSGAYAQLLSHLRGEDFGQFVRNEREIFEDSFVQL